MTVHFVVENTSSSCSDEKCKFEDLQFDAAIIMILFRTNISRKSSALSRRAGAALALRFLPTDATVVADNKDFKIISRAVGPFAMNQYLLMCKATKTAAIVDSGEDPDVFFDEYAQKESFNIAHLLQTHGHIDHVCGLVATKKKYPNAPIYLHKKELTVYNKVNIMALMMGIHCDTPLPSVDIFVEDGQELVIGSLRFNVFFTPGHTPGHVIYYYDSHDTPIAFVGDLVFAGSVGRTDLPGCNQDHMIESIKKIVKILPDKTLLLPGHMNTTTMGQEIRHNPYVRKMAA